MNTTPGPKIITFDCTAAKLILSACFPNGDMPNCPGCDQPVTPCQLGAVFNKAPWHKALPCLIAMTEVVTYPQAQLTDNA